MKWGRLNKIHLPKLECSIRWFKVSRSSEDSFSWIVFQAGGASNTDTFCNVINILLIIFWCIRVIILSVDQWFNACTIVSNGNSRVSGRTGLLFGPSQGFFFFFYYWTNNSFSANCYASSVNFFLIIIWGSSLRTMTKVWLLVPLKAAFFPKSWATPKVYLLSV